MEQWSNASAVDPAMNRPVVAAAWDPSRMMVALKAAAAALRASVSEAAVMNSKGRVSSASWGTRASLSAWSAERSHFFVSLRIHRW